MTFRFILIFSFLLPSVEIWAEDSIPVNTRTRIYHSRAENFVSQIYLNPAINYYAHSFSISELQLGWEQKSANRALLPQLSSQANHVSFNVFSYMQLNNKSKTWGNAHYKNGQKKNVEWNETSDFMTVYPYVMADTVGGKLFTEEYYFAGGYAREGKFLTWGIYANYRALMEHRKIDPRPKNVVSDLKGSIGISAGLNKRYSLGIAFHTGKYKQTNNVRFYSELASATTYHLFGLGMDSRRFWGTNTSVYYNGYRYGASLELFPRDKNGFSAAIHYEKFFFEKIISTLNNLPLNELNQNDIKTELAYMTNNPGHTWGIKINASYQNRKGTENLFGDASMNVYPQIGAVEQLSAKTTRASLSGIYGKQNREKSSWFVIPRLEVNRFEIKYADPARLMKLSNFTGGINLSGSTNCKKSTFLINIDGAYHRNTDANLQITEINENTNVLMSPVYLVFDNLSADSWSSDISLRWEYALPKNKGIFLKLSWQHNAYKSDIRQENIQTCCGLIF